MPCRNSVSCQRKVSSAGGRPSARAASCPWQVRGIPAGPSPTVTVLDGTLPGATRAASPAGEGGPDHANQHHEPASPSALQCLIFGRTPSATACFAVPEWVVGALLGAGRGSSPALGSCRCARVRWNCASDRRVAESRLQSTIGRVILSMWTCTPTSWRSLLRRCASWWMSSSPDGGDCRSGESLRRGRSMRCSGSAPSFWPGSR